MSTYANLRARIQRELDRDDISADVSAAIATSIRELEPTPTYFNRFRESTETVDGQEYYDLPSTYLEVLALTIIVNDQRYTLTHMNWSEIENIQSNATYKGRPIAFAIDLQQVRLYPVPDAVYRLEMVGTKSLGVPSGDSDTSAWIDPQHGERCVRLMATIQLLEERIGGAESMATAARMRTSLEEALRRLRAETHRRRSTGRISRGY